MIAIASEGKTKDSEISVKAGRAPYYLFFKGKKLVEAWKNPFAVGGGGAGFAVAKVVAGKSVEKVVVGKAGPNFKGALEGRGVKLVEKTGSVKDAL